MSPIRTNKAKYATRPRTTRDIRLAHEQDEPFEVDPIDVMVLREIYRGMGQSNASEESSVRTKNPVSTRPPPLTLKDLECHNILGNAFLLLALHAFFIEVLSITAGRGAYSYVLLVRSRRDTHKLDKPGSLFAMKRMKKDFFQDLDKYEVQGKEKDNERAMMSQLPWNPFVAGLVQTFHDDMNLYLMSELVVGGTLKTLIEERAPFNRSMTAFYFSNIVCALHFLERYGVHHGDLKPDNILIGTDGYLCLTDFGCSHDWDFTLWWSLGTPAYIAPEQMDPNSQSLITYAGIDWYAAGCVLYEMLSGKLLFQGSEDDDPRRRASGAPSPSSGPHDTEEPLQRGDDWFRDIRVGKKLASLLNGLVEFNCTERLGARGAIEVMRHEWLNKVSWPRMRARRYMAPWIPPTPRPQETWHKEDVPLPSAIPGLEIVPPPLRLAHDDRFPEKPVIED